MTDLPHPVQLLILHTVSERPLHGYGIAREIRRRSRARLSIAEGSLYPTLARLTARGLLARMPARSKGGKEVLLYALTDSGRVHLRTEAELFRCRVGEILAVIDPSH